MDSNRIRKKEKKDNKNSSLIDFKTILWVEEGKGSQNIW